MKFFSCLLIAVFSLFVVFPAVGQEVDQPIGSKRGKKFQYEEVDFEELMKRYFLKEKPSDLEGIYSVSCIITKRSRMFLSHREKEKVVGREDNYARVAIIKDFKSSKQDFIEISLNYHDAKKYPIVGSFDGLSEGKGFIYQHIEPDGKLISFSMIPESPELFEGEFSMMKGRKTITYRLSYLKTYPKASQVVSHGDY